ncbi:MAG: hypothetical protein AB8B71_13190 [Paracoccaceae bacterium]
MSVLTAPQRQPVISLSRFGFWCACLAFVVALAALGYSGWAVASQQPGLKDDILQSFEITHYVTDLTTIQTCVAWFFWIWVDLLGLVMIWQILVLFQSLRHGQIVLKQISMQLRRLGLILVALPLVNILGILIGGMTLSFWITNGQFHGSISIDDSDVYAVIVGLVLVALGHIMVMAAEIEDENRAFV